MLTIILQILSTIFISVGLCFCSISILGLIRMPDIYTKQHALSLIDGGGSIFLFIGIAFSSNTPLLAFKAILLATIILIMSAPITYAFMQIVIRKDRPKLNNKSKDI